MPPVNITEIPGLQGTRINSARADARTAGAPAAALSGIAEGIASVNKAFLSIADDIQSKDDARKISTARLGWRSGLAELNLELAKDPDPISHQKRLDEYLYQAQAAIETQDISPRVRDHLENKFAEFATGATNANAANAAKLAVERARLALDAEMDAATRANDPGAFETALETAAQAGIAHLPEQQDALRRNFRSQTAFNSTLTQIQSDPIAAEEDLESPDFIAQNPDLSPEALDRLRRYANQEANRSKGEMWDGILNGALNDGADRALISRDELRDLADAGTITPEQRASYIRAYLAPESPEFDAYTYNTAFSAITQYNPANDPSGAVIASLRGELATLALPKEHVAELRDRLNARLDSGSGKAKHKLEGDFSTYTAKAFDAGRFGNWYSWVDHDNSPWTDDIKTISFDDYGRALATKHRFEDAWDAYLRNQTDALDPLEAQKTYDSLFETIVLDNDEPQASPMIPGAPPAVDFSKDLDSLLNPKTPPTTPKGAGPTLKETSSTFGGQRIQPPGTFYRNARPTVFGGENDPVDNGLSAFGGATGAGGREGVAIPHDILKATFPGKDKKWFAENVRAVVKTADGRQAILPVADLGTAEWVWETNQRPVLDLTPGAVKQLGGRPVYKDGKLSGVSGLGPLSFALTTDNAGTEADLAGMDWNAAQDAWFKDKRPTSGEQITSGLAALRSAWLRAQADAQADEPEAPGLLPDLPTAEVGIEAP